MARTGHQPQATDSVEQELEDRVEECVDGEAGDADEVADAFLSG
ncbi:hypothetical protein [Haloarcula rubra]|nr:hypothetical protein [Halomicroarcula rubra]